MTSSARRLFRIAATTLPVAVVAALAAVAVLTNGPAQAVSASLVLAEVYGGGGNAGPPAAPYKNDFVELRNIGGSPVDVSSYSVQYASATGSSWQVTPLAGSIPAGGAFLVGEASGGSTGVDLPTPDVTGTINLSATRRQDRPGRLHNRARLRRHLPR